MRAGHGRASRSEGGNEDAARKRRRGTAREAASLLQVLDHPVDGRVHLLDAPHLTIFPGILLAIVVLGFNFLGDGLRDAIDPRRK